MSKKLDPQVVWDVLMKDDYFLANGPAEGLPIFKQYVMAIPNILESKLLESKMNLNILVRAKLLFLRYCLDHGLAEQMARIVPVSAEKLQQDMMEVYGHFEPIGVDTPIFLQHWRFDEEEVLANPKFALTPEMRKKIKRGITLHQFILEYPSRVLLNER